MKYFCAVAVIACALALIFAACSGSVKEEIPEYINLGDAYDLDALDKVAECKKEGMVSELKQSANDRIFRHAYDNAEWFANEFYSRRNEETFIRENIETYLLKQKCVDDFLMIAVARIDKELKKIACEFVNDKNIKINHKLDIRGILKNNLPNARTMAEEVYKMLEMSGTTSKYRAKLLNVYQEYRTRNPKTTITAEAFVGIGTIVIANMLLPGAGTLLVAGGITASIGVLEFKTAADVEKFESELNCGIKKTQKDFEFCLETAAQKIVAAFVDKLKTAKISSRRPL